MKKLIALLLTFAVTLSLLSVAVFAADYDPRARRVKITASKRTVSVGKTIYLDVSVYPEDLDYDEVKWSTGDYDLIDLDSYGEVVGLEPGTATVRAVVYRKGTDPTANKDKLYRIGSSEIEIKVTGSSPSGGTGILPREVDDDGNVISTSKTNGAITSTTVSNAVKKALVKGSTTSTTFKDYESVSAFALQSAATAMSGGTVMLHFDTTSDGKAVEGRLTINPKNAANLKNDIKVGVYTNNVQTYKARGTFEKYFKNEVVIIRAAHSGSYGMEVKFAVKIGTSLAKAKSLKLYTYNPETNKYNEVKNSSIRVDANGYAHFTTTVGDYLVISNGALAKK